jgi:caffeoyl-CoA O-methyltransferase
MALALPPAGHIWTIDPDSDRTQVASSYLERAGKLDAVEFINQPALEVLPSMNARNLDIVFIDAVATEYEAYLELCVPMLKRSGLILVDNLLLGGEAGAEPGTTDSEDVRAIRSFSKAFLNHPQLDATILPIGDGFGIGARID